MLRFIINFFLRYTFRVNCYVNIVLNKKSNIIIILLKNYLYIKKNIYIGRNVLTKGKIKLPHPHNIVIGSETVIGNNVIIYHDVTLGQNKGKYPILGNNIIIYAGAKIIGNVKIGDNAIIGANAVVTKDVPENAIVGGIPARVMKYREKDDEFY